MITVLWVDDEITHLQSHIRYLEKHEYKVLTASSGKVALDLLRENRVDIVLMDQMMVGMDGLETVSCLRKNYHVLPVVMVTQSEEEELMDLAIGGEVDDYLTKPVNPSQILLVIKRLVMGTRLKTQRAAREMVDQTVRIMEMRSHEMDWQEWVNIYRSWMEKDVASEGSLADEMKTVQKTRFDDLAIDFSKHVERRYPDWIASTGSDSPLMSHNYLERVVAPRLESSNELVMLIIDCMRYDQWLTMAPVLEKWFHIETEFMFTVLPSATPYSRNSIFAGLLPRDIWRFHRHRWVEQYGVPGLNRYEPEFLSEALKRLGCGRNSDPDYVKISNRREGEILLHSLSRHMQNGFLSIVVNYIDHLTHGRSELDLIRDLAPDVASFRSLAETWFKSSFLKILFQTLAARGTTVLVTSDHGSVFTTRDTRIRGRGVSGSIRYRYGNSLSVDPRTTITTRKPAEWGLPDDTPAKTYLFARSDYFMMFQNVPRNELQKFRNTFQHGGVSLEEMIVPSIVLTPKNMN
ncbi:MAG: response regulator [Candidatus Fermentibacteraceae bacterium]|nr:response regulator [Candidatus Fermentibacteraceae bacterium]